MTGREGAGKKIIITAFLIFTAAAAYFYMGRNPVPLPDFSRLFLFLFFLLSSYDAGCLLTIGSKGYAGFNALVKIAISLGAGFVMISVAVMAMLAAGFCTKFSYAALLSVPIVVQIAVLAASAVLGRGNRMPEGLRARFDIAALARDASGEIVSGLKNSFGGGNGKAAALLDILILSLLIFSFAASGLPVINGDAQSYHLEIPKHYIQNQKFYFLSDNYYCGNPQLMHFVYSIFMMFDFDTLAATFHGLYLWLLVVVVLNFPFQKLLGHEISAIERKICALVLLTHPEMMMLTTFANVDLAVVFYFFTSALLMASGESFLAGALLGGALSAKYNGLVISAVVFAVALFTGGAAARERLKNAVFIIAVAYLFFSPQLIKNFAFTGNPLYPFFKNVFPTEKIAYSCLEDYQAVMSGALGDKSASGIVSFPLLSALNSDWAGLLKYDGRMGLSFFLLIPFFLSGLAGGVFQGARKAREFFAMCGALFFLYYVYVLNVQSTRQFLPIFPFFALVSAVGISRRLSAGPETEAGEFEAKAPEETKASKSRPLSALPLAFAAAALLFNLSPMFSVFAGLEPAGYIFGLESREAYLERNLDIWPIIKAYNANGDPGARLFMPFDQRAYYFTGRYLWNEFCDYDALGKILQTGPDGADDGVLKNFRARGITHILVSLNSINNVLAAGENLLSMNEQARLYYKRTRLKISPEKWKKFLDFISNKTEPLIGNNFYELRSVSRER